MGNDGPGRLLPQRRVCLVEWPERVADCCPPADLDLTLTHATPAADGGRDLALSRSDAGG